MNISPSLSKRIDELNSRIENSQNELFKLRAIYSKFPDLQVKYDRWQQIRYFSSEANSIVNDVDIQYTCGVVIARPLIVYNGFNIFSDPIDFIIGIEGNSYHAYDFCGDWEAQLIVKNINQIVIEKVRAYVIKFTAVDEDAEADYTNQGNE